LAGEHGEVWLLDQRLRPGWKASVSQRVQAVAVAGLGERIAATDRKGNVAVFDQMGHLRWRALCPRPLSLLAFVPEEPALVGSADHGLVTAFDEAGACIWRDGLVAHVGSLATTGDGATLACACFTEGVIAYSLNGPARRPLHSTPCRLAALSYDGGALVSVGLGGTLALHHEKKKMDSEHNMESSVVSIAVDGLGKSAVVALADGTILRLQM
jgi:hypothetical protein